MAPEAPPNVWVPVCCSRVMRFNRFLRQDGAAYGSLVCTICNKNIVLEQEAYPAENAYGEGTRVLSVLGSPKPPKTDRRKAEDQLDTAVGDEPTL
jgi:hypothetical protein